MIIFDSTDIAATARTFDDGYRNLSDEGLPGALYVQQLAMTTPVGKVFAVAYFWGSDDHEEGQSYLAKVAALGTPIMNTVASSTLAAFLEIMKASVPPNAYGSIETLSIRGLTSEAIETIARNVEKMPATLGTAFSMHELRGASAAPNGESVFGSREPHFMMELITTVADRGDLKGAQEWASLFLRELKKMNSSNILPGTYISLTPDGSNSFENIFGSNFEALLGLKQKHDPEGIFALAPPQLK